MGALAKIAFRNVLANRRRSALIGLTIFISSLVLLLSNATANGVESQMLKSYINLQSGHVTVIWDSLKDRSNVDPNRLLFLKGGGTLEFKHKDENRVALETLERFLAEHKDQVAAVHRTVRRNASLIVKRNPDTLFTLYGLSEGNKQFLLDTKTITMKTGALLSDGIAISNEKARELNLAIGDTVELEAVKADGDVAKLTMKVRGIYADGAGYDAFYGFVSERDARTLTGLAANEFDITRIYLKDPGQAKRFASELDKSLLSSAKVLRAESYEEASAFYTNVAKTMKALFTVFILVLFFIIAVGLRSTVRLNLFERMKEFGTIRAIGFSRFQSYTTIFMEVLFLAIFAFVCAFGVVMALMIAFAQTGVYVGSGAITYVFGGDRFYPSLRVSDVLLALLVMLLFSIVSTLSPAIQLLFQNITDIMARRQKNISLIRLVFARRG